MASANRLTNNPWAVLALLCLGLFMTLLDITIVNIAIPSLSRGLHASLDQRLRVVNAYGISAGLVGKVNAKRLLVLGLALCAGRSGFPLI